MLLYCKRKLCNNNNKNKEQCRELSTSKRSVTYGRWAIRTSTLALLLLLQLLVVFNYAGVAVAQASTEGPRDNLKGEICKL